MYLASKTRRLGFEGYMEGERAKSDRERLMSCVCMVYECTAIAWIGRG